MNAIFGGLPSGEAERFFTNIQAKYMIFWVWDQFLVLQVGGFDDLNPAIIHFIERPSLCLDWEVSSYSTQEKVYTPIHEVCF